MNMCSPSVYKMIQCATCLRVFKPLAASTSVARGLRFTTSLWYFGVFTLTMLLRHFGRPW